MNMRKKKRLLLERCSYYVRLPVDATPEETAIIIERWLSRTDCRASLRFT